MIVISVTRKPLAESTVAANVLKYGCGSINIEASRIASGDEVLNGGAYAEDATDRHDGAENWRFKRGKKGGLADVQYTQPSGRWPANIILSHYVECRCVGTTKVKASAPATGPVQDFGSSSVARGKFNGGVPTPYYGDADGMESISVWECVPGCPISDLDKQSGVSQSGFAGVRNALNGYDGGWGATAEAFGSSGDTGGASRFFKQVVGVDKMSSEVPKDLLDYLYTMITPTHVGGETFIALDLNAVDWPSIQDAQYHGVIARGEPTEEQTEQLWRIIKPGAHVMLIAPDERPTGHRGACSLENRGFEIRDAILWVREAGKLHYVPKCSTRERNLGCEVLAANRKGTPVYELTEAAQEDEELLSSIQEALVEAGIEEAVADAIVENGLSKDQIPEGFGKHFKKRKGSDKYGNLHPCLHPESLVMTDKGFRPIKEVKLGDRVYSKDGMFHEVEHVSTHPYQSANIYEISVQGTNYKTRVSDNHPFLVWRVSRTKKGNVQKGEVLWVEASQLRVGDYTLTPIMQHGSENSETLEFWFLFGLWIAEGVVQRAGHGENTYPSYSLHKKETALVDKIKGYFGESKVGVYSKGENGIQVIAFVPGVAPKFKYLGGCGASTKEFHPSIWNLNLACKQAIFEGYMAGDGGRVKGRKHQQAKTVSPDLASQVYFLAESIGYKSNLYRYDPVLGAGIGDRLFKSVKPVYSLSFHDQNQTLMNRKPSKPEFIEFEGIRYCLRYIKSVESIPYVGDVWNLSVEGSPTFQTAVGMSHNTVKPKEVMVRLLGDVPKDALVLDPFLGSGTTGIACIETGHNFIGIEREENYLQIATDRIDYWNKIQNNWKIATIESDVPASEGVALDQEGGLFDLD